jgi:hypothetical protein
MKLGKGHLVASLVMTALATIYAVWSFTSPRTSASPSAAEPSTPVTPPPAVAGAAVAPPIDPMQIPPVPDIALDVLPEWPRNPFVPSASLLAPPPAIEVAPAAEPETLPDVVVSAILYSSTRRVAMVGGRRVRIGDRLGNETVVDIAPNSIVLESPAGDRRTVERRAPGSRVRPDAGRR